jgi:ATPase subunit of ABC transporter with duplicated ATPase domains
MKQILALSRARKSYDGKVVLDDVTLGFSPGTKIGVVGPNGTGKSTLLTMMAGLEQPSNGEVMFMPGCTRGILAQEPVLDEGKTVLGNVEDGVAATRVLLDRYEEIAAKLAADYSDDLLEEMGLLYQQLDHAGAWDLDARLEQAMDALRCPPPDADVSMLSGGERRRVALCRLLLSQLDLLLLDEPTNHLDAESVQWLEQHLARYPGTVVAVTHDRYFLDNVAGWILELDRGHAYPYEGNYSTYPDTFRPRVTSPLSISPLPAIQTYCADSAWPPETDGSPMLARSCSSEPPRWASTTYAATSRAAAARIASEADGR